MRARPRSADVGAGTVVDAGIEGHFIVLWRTVDGRLVACAGRCPHQWSPLDLEGAVEGDELVCRAHGWRFAPDGAGTKVNVKGRRDPKGDIETHGCVEVDGEIWVDITSPST